ncbi:MAG: hypothetical protein ACK4K9_00085 [Bacteroidia bacterium]
MKTEEERNIEFGFEICPYCSSTKGFDYVHSHYQCKNCKINILPCCGGENQVDEIIV